MGVAVREVVSEVRHHSTHRRPASAGTVATTVGRVRDMWLVQWVVGTLDDSEYGQGFVVGVFFGIDMVQDVPVVDRDVVASSVAGQDGRAGGMRIVDEPHDSLADASQRLRGHLLEFTIRAVCNAELHVLTSLKPVSARRGTRFSDARLLSPLRRSGVTEVSMTVRLGAE